MDIKIREYTESDVLRMTEIWNEVVRDGVAFPQEEYLTLESGTEFFLGQTYTAVAEETGTGEVIGLYILHPNNIGRCGHICNASYAVSSEHRGRGVGAKLVLDCIEKGRRHGFAILQFNAVVASNSTARHLYEKLGFIPLGIIPGGFRMKDGHFEDICPYYYDLTENDNEKK